MSPVRPSVTVVGSRFDAAGYRLRDFLTRTAQPHTWVEAGTPESERILESLGLVEPPLPVVIDGERTFVEATVEALAAAWTSQALPSARTTTSRSSAPGRPGSGRPSMPRRMGSQRLCSSGTCQAGKPRTRR